MKTCFDRYDVAHKRCLALVVASLIALSGVPAHAQSSWLTGYLQTVPLVSAATEISESNIAGFSRFRLSTEPVLGSVSFEAAYEHALTGRQREASAGLGIGVVPSGGEWLDLEWTIEEEEHVRWRHRFDRLNVGWSPTRSMDLSVGRQAVSWGTTLFLTPADPFLPFSPSDPFRQFRGGVDAGRLRLYPGPLSSLDLVVRPTDTAVGEELTALLRGLTTWKNWELSGWGGTLYGDRAAALGAAGGVGVWAVRVEAVIREIRGRVVGRGSLGLDRILQIDGRDLFVVLEYQRDGLAAAGPSEYLDILESREFQRGELQVLGRDEAVFQASYQLHPLWSLGGLWLWNLNDRSALLAPTFGYSAGDEASIGGGVYFGFGKNEITPERPLPSEYGLSGTTGYVSLSWFF